MKLLFLTLIAVCFAETYTPIFKEELKYCSTVNFESSDVNENGPIYICSGCYPGFSLVGETRETKKCVPSAGNVKYPAYVPTGSEKIEYRNLGFDTTSGTCTSSIKVVDGNQGKEYKDDVNSKTPCLTCAEYVGTSTSKCQTCAAGYLLKNGNCVPQSIGPFGGGETDDKCYNGKYDDKGSPVCGLCKEESFCSNSECVPVSIPDNKFLYCMKLSVSIGGDYKCEECVPDYVLNAEGTCVAIKSNFCLTSDSSGKCTKCLPGYYVKADGCALCNADAYKGLEEFKDYCNVFSYDECGACDQNCVYEDDLCISRHCSLFANGDRCVRCEAGYILRGEECYPSEYDGFSGEEKKQCADGYYMAKDSQNNYVCLPCQGNCRTCVSDKKCIVSVDITGSTKTKSVFPTFDSNCIHPNSYDPSVCLECKEGTVLLGGRCYTFGKERSNSDGITIGVCDYYEMPDIIYDGNKRTSNDFVHQYIRTSETYYIRTQNYVQIPNTSTKNYLCEYHDDIPYYYVYNKTAKSFSCRGLNRNVNNDCECNDGYYPTGASKLTECLKYTSIPRCEKVLSDKVCVKCQDPLQLNYVYDEVTQTKVLECGCPKGQRYQTVNGVATCVSCSLECDTCRTKVVDGVEYEQCLTCKGTAQGADYEDMKQADFNRDIKTNCKCKKGYYSLEETGEDAEVNSCYEPPEVCKNDGNFEPEKYGIKCIGCDGENKDWNSQPDPCTACLPGFYKKTTENDEFSCLDCPSGSFKDKPVEYCSKCVLPNGETDPVCDGECIHETLSNLEGANCQKCIGGNRYIYIHQYSEGNSVVNPYCVKCPDYCATPDSEVDPLCFYGKIADIESTDNSVNTDEKYNLYKNDFKKGIIYPSDMTDYKLYCSKCGGNKNPKLDCICDPSQFNNGVSCQDCKEVFETDYCDFTQKDTYVCPRNDDNNGYIECVKCAEKYKKRIVSTNCTLCEDGTYITEDNGGCTDCPPQCKGNCHKEESGKMVCDECTDSETRTPYCETCVDSFFMPKSDSWTLCQKCHSDCTLCTGNEYNCQACVHNTLPWNNSNGKPQFYRHDEVSTDEETGITYYGCIACPENTYYDFNSRKCLDRSTSKLFVSSIAVCVKKHQTLNITGLPDRGKDERGSLQLIYDCSDKNAIGYEWATECDNEYNPESDNTLEIYKKGMLRVPSNGECVCKEGYVDIRSKSEITGENPDVKQIVVPKCIDIREATKVDLCTDAEFDKYVNTTFYKTEYKESAKNFTDVNGDIDFTTIDLITKVTSIDGKTVLMDSEKLSQSTIGEVENICNGNCTIYYNVPYEVISHYDMVATFKCTKCNADYLKIENGKCVCDTSKGYYQTRWGMCIPCDRHISGCKQCKIDESIKINPSVPGHIRQQLKCTACSKGKLKDNQCVEE